MKLMSDSDFHQYVNTRVAMSVLVSHGFRITGDLVPEIQKAVHLAYLRSGGCLFSRVATFGGVAKGDHVFTLIHDRELPIWNTKADPDSFVKLVRHFLEAAEAKAKEAA